MATILFGVILGFAFGLTGSGGSALAVPMLVYGLGLAPHRAVCVSMISVGGMATLRAIQKLRAREVEFRTGWIVAGAGLLGAPAGAWLGRMLPEKWLLIVFAGVVALAAFRMLLQSRYQSDRRPGPGQIVGSLKREEPSSFGSCPGPANLPALSVIGLVTGFLAGLLGIGGGFVVIPALVLCCGLEIHLAIATSMFSIALISAAAMTAHWFAGQRPPLDIIGLFTLGGLLGLAPGCLLARRLSGPRLQRVFAVALLLLVAFIIIRSVREF